MSELSGPSDSEEVNNEQSENHGINCARVSSSQDASDVVASGPSNSNKSEGSAINGEDHDLESLQRQDNNTEFKDGKSTMDPGKLPSMSKSSEVAVDVIEPDWDTDLEVGLSGGSGSYPPLDLGVFRDKIGDDKEQRVPTTRGREKTKQVDDWDDDYEPQSLILEGVRNKEHRIIDRANRLKMVSWYLSAMRKDQKPNLPRMGKSYTTLSGWVQRIADQDQVTSAESTTRKADIGVEGLDEFEKLCERLFLIGKEALDWKTLFTLTLRFRISLRYSLISLRYNLIDQIVGHHSRKKLMMGRSWEKLVSGKISKKVDIEKDHKAGLALLQLVESLISRSEVMENVCRPCLVCDWIPNCARAIGRTRSLL